MKPWHKPRDEMRLCRDCAARVIHESTASYLAYVKPATGDVCCGCGEGDVMLAPFKNHALAPEHRSGLLCTMHRPWDDGLALQPRDTTGAPKVGKKGQTPS
jgi:hypothetical protein